MALDTGAIAFFTMMEFIAGSKIVPLLDSIDCNELILASTQLELYMCVTSTRQVTVVMTSLGEDNGVG